VFRLPDVLSPVEALSLVVTSAVVKVTDDAVGLAISLRCDVLREGDRAAAKEPPRLEERHPEGQPSVAPSVVVRRRTPPVALLGGLGALVLGVAFALGRMSGHRHGWLPG
jgi:hypothetical protein